MRVCSWSVTTVASELSYLASHREKPASHFPIEDPLISDPKPRSREFHNSTLKRSMSFKRTEPLYQENVKCQTFDRESLMLLTKCTCSRRSFKVLLVVSLVLERLKSTRSKVPKDARF